MRASTDTTTEVISDGKTYMNEAFTQAAASGDTTWELHSDFSYGEVSTPGAFPMTPGKPMKVVLTLERPIGESLSSWTMVAKSCDSSALLYNGPTAADLDGDYVATPTDKCPTLKSFRANGCPLRDRTLALNGKYDPKRVVGRLYAPGYPALYAGRTVTIWKVKTGPDRKVTTRTTNSLGKFKAYVGKGRYYATARGVIVASAGQVTSDKSVVRRLR